MPLLASAQSPSPPKSQKKKKTSLTISDEGQLLSACVDKITISRPKQTSILTIAQSTHFYSLLVEEFKEDIPASLKTSSSSVCFYFLSIVCSWNRLSENYRKSAIDEWALVHNKGPYRIFKTEEVQITSASTQPWLSIHEIWLLMILVKFEGLSPLMYSLIYATSLFAFVLRYFCVMIHKSLRPSDTCRITCEFSYLYLPKTFKDLSYMHYKHWNTFTISFNGDVTLSGEKPAKIVLQLFCYQQPLALVMLNKLRCHAHF